MRREVEAGLKAWLKRRRGQRIPSAEIQDFLERRFLVSKKRARELVAEAARLGLIVWTGERRRRGGKVYTPALP